MSSDALVNDLKTVVRNHLAEDTRRARLLRQIDQKAADPFASLHEAIVDITRKTERAVRAKSSSVYLTVCGNHYDFSKTQDFLPIRSHKTSAQYYTTPDNSAQLSYTKSDIFASFSIGTESQLTICLSFSHTQLNTKLFRFLKQFLDQINLLIHYKIIREQTDLQQAISKDLFSSRLRPTQAWQTILDGIQSYIPEWCPGSGRSDVVQLLLARPEEGTLHLVAGQGANRLSEFVLIDDSVTGQAVREGWSEPTLIRTEDFSKEYKSYRKTSLDYELVVPIVFESRVIAIINFESNEPRNYNSLFIDYCQTAASFVAPILASLQHRFRSFRAKEVSLLYVLNDMLQRMGEAFGHLVSQPFLITKLSSGELKYLLENEPTNTSAMSEEIDKISTNIELIEEECNKFISSLPDFLQFGPQSVSTQVEHRLSGLRKLARSHNIKLLYHWNNQSHDAYASRLFVEHVFNIVNNSFQQIRKKQLEAGEDNFKGRIIVSSKLKQSVTPAGNKTGIDFVEIVVSDNGGGADDETLRKIGVPGETTKIGGTGFGVAAALEYFSSVGGEMTFGNYRNGLRTVIKMQRYDPAIHGERRSNDAQRRSSDDD